MSANKLCSEIVESFSSLKLSLLNLSRNKLAGRVPDAFLTLAYNGSFAENPDSAIITSSAYNNSNFATSKGIYDGGIQPKGDEEE
ncbi:hypothetical protein MRB53_005644 [Persea americana]|uniref:Uncharacterized protein n=1 Tax=Persea americana TaxID=3435 RepID=A0ACC2MEU0_PERAE|nr:hypothetical protein MRB53_005644 [Persea americana]